MHGRPPRARPADVQNPFLTHSVVVEVEGLIVSALQVELLVIRPERGVIAEAVRQQKA